MTITFYIWSKKLKNRFKEVAVCEESYSSHAELIWLSSELLSAKFINVLMDN